MDDIRIIEIDNENFNAHSLDDFIRHQVVKECWRNVEGEWKLLPIAFTEEWSNEKCQAEANEILTRIGADLIAFAAIADKKVVGYITVNKNPIGAHHQYVQLEGFQVSEPFRGQGIGKVLFARACDAAREMAAEKLYISSHSSKESQAAYRSLGCVLAAEIIPRIAEAEPYDVQLEYRL